MEKIEIIIKGGNGSGKTELLNLLIPELEKHGYGIMAHDGTKKMSTVGTKQLDGNIRIVKIKTELSSLNWSL